MIHVNDLVIEVTRRCNYKCMHCLRGDAQNLDISGAILEEIAKNVIADNVVFTGGEPALNIPAMKLFLKYAEKYKTFPCSFYIATNGSVNQEELAMFSLKMYAEMEDKDYCTLALSIDPYHGYPDKKSEIYSGLAFFDNSKMRPMDILDEEWILQSGRAAENGMAGFPNCFPVSWDEIEVEKLCGEWYLEGTTLYVSSNGKIAFNCDMSYEEIDNVGFGDIFELEKNFEKYKKEDVDQ